MVREVPDGWLARAILPLVDAKTLRVPVDDKLGVQVCAGATVTLRVEEDAKDGVATVKVVRHALPRTAEGHAARWAVWIILRTGDRGLGDSYQGVLAIVDFETRARAIVVDAVGEWTSNTAPHSLEPHVLARQRVYAEPQAREEGGWAGRSDQVWLEKNGRLYLVGSYPEEEGSASGDSFVARTFAWGDALRIEGEATAVATTGRPRRTHSVVRRWVLRPLASGDATTDQPFELTEDPVYRP